MPMDYTRYPLDWKAISLRIRERDGVAFFHKQGGSRYPGAERELNGRTYDDLHWRQGVVVETVQQEAMF